MTAHAHPPVRFKALDGLRFVGAVAVLTTHVGFYSGDAVNGPFAGYLARLDAGVALFFAVSGFLLFRPHVMAHLEGRPRPATGSYLVKRAVRILPVLWVSVVLAYLLVRDPGARISDYAQVAGLVQIYLDNPQLPGLTQYWSLATEVSFYLVLPLIAWVLCRGADAAQWIRRTSAVLGLAVVAGPIWMAVMTHLGHPGARGWLPGYLGWFAVGMMLAIWHAGRSLGLISYGVLDRVGAHRGTVWALAAAVYLLSTSALAGPFDLTEPTPAQAAMKNLLYTALAFLIVLPTVVPVGHSPAAIAAFESKNSVENGALAKPPLSWLGTISYGIFGYHVIIVSLSAHLDALAPFTGHFWVRWVIAFGGAVAVAAVSYYLMERPLMRSIRPRRRPPAPGALGSADSADSADAAGDDLRSRVQTAPMAEATASHESH